MATTPMESFQEFLPEWEDLLTISPVNSIYLTPQWQQIWWDYFGDNREMAGFYMHESGSLMAVASLSKQGDEVTFTGGPETFDYNDFLVRPGFETAFFPRLFGELQLDDVKSITLCSLKEGSPTLMYLPDVAETYGFVVTVTEEDVAPGLELPETWEEYLSQLSKKDRHELRRKFRRLESLENWNWYCLQSDVDIENHLDDFLRLMRMSAPEKEEYMTDEREQFFRSMSVKMARLGLVKLFFLEINGVATATSLCFDYGLSRLLYNSGDDPAMSFYSVGLLMNAICLRDAIEHGEIYFDFLRGSEPYKYHLGGKNHILYQMVVTKS